MAWVRPNIDLPTYTYQCMPMELKWYDGSPPFSVWFRRDARDGAATVKGLGAWFNLTGRNYLVPCIAPAGSSIELVVQDSTGTISTSRGNFLVLPSSNNSCLSETPNAAGLSESQSTLSTILWNFQQSIISAISASAVATETADPRTIPATSYSGVIQVSAITSEPGFASRSASATSIPIPTTTPSSSSTTLGRILGPVLGSLLGVLLCIVIGIYLVRRRRQQRPEQHIPLHSTASFDLLDGDRSGSVSRLETATREAGRPATAPSLTHPTSLIHPTDLTTDVNMAAVPRNRLRLHDGTATAWPSSVKNRQSEVPPLPETTEQAPSTPTIQVQDQRTLEQRAEQLSPPELERLAALVARRLERVRGAPPQYQATEGIGV